MSCLLVKWGIKAPKPLGYPIKALGGPLNSLWERSTPFISFCSCFSRFEFATFKGNQITVKMICLLVKMGYGKPLIIGIPH